MSARPMIRDWRQHVRHDLLPDLHGHQANALTDLSFAMAAARHCHSGKLAAIAPGDTTPAATKRRLERTLANDRLDPEAAWPQLARATLAGFAGGPIVLILDETPNHNDLRCLKITLAYRKRALSIRSVCYAPGGQGEPMPELIDRLLREVAAVLPEGAEVALLADRGLAWPQVVDACTELGWHYVIRLQGQTRVRAADGSESTAAELAPRPGTSWHGAAEAFKKSRLAPGGGGRLLDAGLRRAVAAGQRPRRWPAAVPAVREADLDRGVVQGREVVGLPLGAEPCDRPGARGPAGAPDRLGDVPGAGPGVAGDPGGAAAAAGVEPAANLEPLPDRLAVLDVLPDA